MSLVPKATDLPIDWDRWVVVGLVLGAHGLPKEGVWTFRVKMLHTGSEALKNPPVVRVSPPPMSQLIELDCTPVQESSPLGAKWGQNTETLLRVSMDLTAYKNSSVSVPRKSLTHPDDLLLDDLLGFEVWETQDSQSRVGSVVGAGWAHPRGSSFLMIQALGETLEIPMDWISWEESRPLWDRFGKVLCVPGATQWKV